jgi:endonuclease/exonuclease/phosphatase (EEP) superfamily protein YafD
MIKNTNFEENPAEKDAVAGVGSDDSPNQDIPEKFDTKPKLIAKKPITYIFWFFIGLYLFFLMLDWVNSAGFIPSNSFISGFDYIPPLGILVLMIPGFILSLIVRQWKVALAMVGLFFVFWLTNGDHSLFDLNAKQKPLSSCPNNNISALTLNVAQFYIGIDKLGAKIEELHPDVICFQELEDLNKIGYEDVKKAFPSYNIFLGKNTDNAILSLEPFVEMNEVELPSKQPVYEKNTPDKLTNQPHRYFLHAVTTKNGEKVNVLNLRLIAGRGMNLQESPKEVVRWGKYLMEQQGKEVETMTSYMKKLDGPCIYMGDLNASPNCSIIKPFYSIGKDAFRATHKFPGKSFPADFPYWRLDYVFSTPDLNPIYSDILPWKMSDHRPVYAVFSLKDTKCTKN